MYASKIRPGRTYCKIGKHTTIRSVVAIGIEHRPAVDYHTSHRLPAANEPGVLFVQNGQQHQHFLSDFERWAENAHAA